jgi:glucosamine--fructose-6-phosphate aminotransferase (isomerizing)
MLKEIHEQPEALAQSIAGGSGRDDRIARASWTARAASGRSARGARGLRQRLYARSSARPRSRTGPGCRRGSRSGSEFRYSPPPLDEDTLVIAVTQSGETADTIAPTRYAREQGCPIVAVTNTVGSAITREADAVLFLQAGPEIAVAGVEDVRDPGDDAHRARRGHRQGARRHGRRAGAGAGAALRALPRPPAGARDLADGAPDLARRYVNSRGFMFVGRGYGYPRPLEGALKLKEVSYIHAEGYAAGELKHGPISLLDAECPLVAVATRSRSTTSSSATSWRAGPATRA